MCLALLAVLVSFYTGWMLTHPPRRTYAGQVARGRPGVPDELVPARVYRPFGFTAETLRGETLPGWIIAGDAPAGPRVIITHGWSNSKHGALTRVPAVAREASEVVLWDMRGGGEAPGWCALGAVEHKDLLALLAAMPDDRPTVLYGWSMGAGVALSAAASDDPRSACVIGVVAEAPYRVPDEPARAVLREYRLPHGVTLRAAGWLTGVAVGLGPRWRGFDRREIAARVGVPLLVLHGDRDEICPQTDGLEIAAAAPRGEFVSIQGGDHDRLWTRDETVGACGDAVSGFLGRLARPDTDR